MHANPTILSPCLVHCCIYVYKNPDDWGAQWRLDQTSTQSMNPGRVG